MTVTIAKPRDDVRLRMSLETILFLSMLGLIFLVRATNLNYNSLFVDEAANLLVGHDALAGRFDRNATTWFGGSYLYPMIATFADTVYGVTGARLASAVLTTLTAYFVFMAAKRLFGERAALWAMTIFGLTGASISVGQMAVYDVLCLPFLALTFYLLIEAGEKKGPVERKYLLGAGLSYAVATLGKYTAIFYLPALGLFASALYVARSDLRGILRLAVWFLLPAGVIIGAYFLKYFNDLILVFSTQGYQAASRVDVFRVIWDEAGIAILLAIAGIGLVLLSAIQAKSLDSAHLAHTIAAHLRARHRLFPVLTALVIIILIFAFLALPLYQLISENIRSVWKNTVSSLIFLSPFAGYTVETFIRNFQSRPSGNTIHFRILGTLLTITVLFWYVNNALNRNWGLQNSWTNIRGAVNYIKSDGFEKDSRMLVEGGAAFEYYFGVGEESTGIWADTWYMSYEGVQGIEAMKAAIRDRQLDFVVLTSQDTPDVALQLSPILRESGYKVGYEEAQQLSAGDIRVQVYVKP